MEETLTRTVIKREREKERAEIMVYAEKREERVGKNVPQQDKAISA